MKLRGSGPGVLSIALAVACFAAIVILFKLVFAGGSAYPRGSSFLSDPAGTRALYESLERTGGIEVSRNYRPLELWRGSGAVVFYFEAPLVLMLEKKSPLVDEFEKVARRGNRLIVSFSRFRLDPDDKNPLKIEPWEVTVHPAASEDEAGPVSFEPGKAWSVEYEDRGKPVVIERAFGKGTIILAASTFPFSNQALADNRDTGLLVRLIGSGRRVVFDESHFDVVESGSIMGLAIKYRMSGLLVALLLMAVLVVWRGSAAFPPAREIAPAAPGRITGRDSLAGFVGLLRRNVAPAKLLELGWSEWRRTHGRGLNAADADHVAWLIHDPADPVRAYTAAREYLKERKRI